MNGVVKEWAAKAEGDFATAKRESRVTRNRNFDAVCFHGQQCAEKYMKALLIHLGQKPPKSHDLPELHRQLATAYPLWDWPLEELRLLSSAAVAFRYPGESAQKEEAAEALRIATGVRKLIREILGLSRKPARGVRRKAEPR
jgi:HEPN domain-containing protein